VDQVSESSSKYYLGSVLAALDVLEYMANRGEYVSIAEISSALGRTKSNVYRILSTLRSRNYVQQDPESRKYVLGARLWQIAQVGFPQLSIVDIAQPFLDKLAKQVEETVLLSILNGYHGLYLYAKEVIKPLRAYVDVGGLGPLHASATGKALLSTQTETFILEVIGMGLRRFTPQTITGKRALLLELEAIRAQGYAVTRDEWHEGLSGVAAPIQHFCDFPAAAVGISYPTSRASEDKILEMGGQAKQTAHIIAVCMRQHRI